MPLLLPLLLPLLPTSAATPSFASSSYAVRVTNRSLTGAPLLEHPKSSFARNTLNPAWLPFPDAPGGGIFYRTIAAPGTTSYNAIGFVPASDDAGLSYPKATPEMLLHDGPNKTVTTDGADPRAVHRGG